MSHTKQLTSLQLDALKEAANIGAGNAAGALAQFLGRRIDMSVPRTALISCADIASYAGLEEDSQSISIAFRVIGDLPGHFLMLLSEKTGLSLLKGLLPETKQVEIDNMGELEESCLKEVGNIMTASFLIALSVFLKVNLMNSLPEMTICEGGLFSELLLDEFKCSDAKALMLETRFHESEENLNIYLFFLPTETSLKKLLKKLGLP
ncbi:MAG: hypothetical protein GX221_04455 [Candidatus Riflebacteria bacterium]|nr:hypothetical protein [Candidatus Riflebacteria bacterium]